MSPRQLAWRGAASGGIAAGLGWLVANETVSKSWPDGIWFAKAATWGIVAAFVAIALEFAAKERDLPRAKVFSSLLFSLIVGLLAGVVGGSFGRFAALVFGWRHVIGLMILGAGVGAIEGLRERSPVRIRVGSLGGLIGGLAGAFAVATLESTIGPLWPTMGRPLAFIAVGAGVGGGIGLADGLWIRAWLTVIEDDQPGRRLILDSRPVTLGRADHASLTLSDPNHSGVDAEHARISPQADGGFLLEDNRTRLGLFVNQAKVSAAVLKDGDVIRIGSAAIKFRQRS